MRTGSWGKSRNRWPTSKNWRRDRKQKKKTK